MTPPKSPASQNLQDTHSRPTIFPAGVVGDVAEFFYRAAHYPNPTIALVGSLGLLAGITGRSFNVEGSGLNLYLLLLAPTGTGKEAISDGIARLLAAVQARVPAVREFRGPGELVSPSGLIKWLARLNTPSVFSIIGEFGFMLQTMTAPNANANMKGLHGALLKLYHKSGRGAVFDDIAYSDRDNNPGVIFSPAFTLIGEGTPSTFYDALDETNIASGLVSRFSIHETNDSRPYRNLNREVEPPTRLVDAIAALSAECLLLAQGNQVRDVAMTPDATAMFRDFDRWTTDRINNAAAEPTKQLWNRANIKAMKLAALIAVARDHIVPTITVDDCVWATNIVFAQTEALIAKFDRDETGAVAGNEAKQLNAVVRCIYEYVTEPYERFAKYGVVAKMHEQAIFTQSYLSRRVLKMPTFANDRIGATKALHRVIKNLLDADEIRQLPTEQVIQLYNVRPTSFAVSKPDRFFEGQK